MALWGEKEVKTQRIKRSSKPIESFEEIFIKILKEKVGITSYEQSLDDFEEKIKNPTDVRGENIASSIRDINKVIKEIKNLPLIKTSEFIPELESFESFFLTKGDVIDGAILDASSYINNHMHNIISCIFDLEKNMGHFNFEDASDLLKLKGRLQTDLDDIIKNASKRKIEPSSNIRPVGGHNQELVRNVGKLFKRLTKDPSKTYETCVNEFIENEYEDDEEGGEEVEKFIKLSRDFYYHLLRNFDHENSVNLFESISNIKNMGSRNSRIERELNLFLSGGENTNNSEPEEGHVKTTAPRNEKYGDVEKVCMELGIITPDGAFNDIIVSLMEPLYELSKNFIKIFRGKIKMVIDLMADIHYKMPIDILMEWFNKKLSIECVDEIIILRKITEFSELNEEISYQTFVGVGVSPDSKDPDGEDNYISNEIYDEVYRKCAKTVPAYVDEKFNEHYAKSMAIISELTGISDVDWFLEELNKKNMKFIFNYIHDFPTEFVPEIGAVTDEDQNDDEGRLRKNIESFRKNLSNKRTEIKNRINKNLSLHFLTLVDVSDNNELQEKVIELRKKIKKCNNVNFDDFLLAKKLYVNPNHTPREEFSFNKLVYKRLNDESKLFCKSKTEDDKYVITSDRLKGIKPLSQYLSRIAYGTDTNAIKVCINQICGDIYAPIEKTVTKRLNKSIFIEGDNLNTKLLEELRDIISEFDMVYKPVDFYDDEDVKYHFIKLYFISINTSNMELKGYIESYLKKLQRKKRGIILKYQSTEIEYNDIFKTRKTSSKEVGSISQAISKLNEILDKIAAIKEDGLMLYNIRKMTLNINESIRGIINKLIGAQIIIYRQVGHIESKIGELIGRLVPIEESAKIIKEKEKVIYIAGDVLEFHPPEKKRIIADGINRLFLNKMEIEGFDPEKIADELLELKKIEDHGKRVNEFNKIIINNFNDSSILRDLIANTQIPTPKKLDKTRESLVAQITSLKDDLISGMRHLIQKKLNSLGEDSKKVFKQIGSLIGKINYLTNQSIGGGDISLLYSRINEHGAEIRSLKKRTQNVFSHLLNVLVGVFPDNEEEFKKIIDSIEFSVIELDGLLIKRFVSQLISVIEVINHEKTSLLVEKIKRLVEYYDDHARNKSLYERMKEQSHKMEELLKLKNSFLNSGNVNGERLFNLLHEILREIFPKETEEFGSIINVIRTDVVNQDGLMKKIVPRLNKLEDEFERPAAPIVYDDEEDDDEEEKGEEDDDDTEISSIEKPENYEQILEIFAQASYTRNIDRVKSYDMLVNLSDDDRKWLVSLVDTRGKEENRPAYNDFNKILKSTLDIDIPVYRTDTEEDIPEKIKNLFKDDLDKSFFYMGETTVGGSIKKFFEISTTKKITNFLGRVEELDLEDSDRRMDVLKNYLRDSIGTHGVENGEDYVSYFNTNGFQVANVVIDRILESGMDGMGRIERSEYLGKDYTWALNALLLKGVRGLTNDPRFGELKIKSEILQKIYDKTKEEFNEKTEVYAIPFDIQNNVTKLKQKLDEISETNPKFYAVTVMTIKPLLRDYVILTVSKNRGVGSLRIKRKVFRPKILRSNFEEIKKFAPLRLKDEEVVFIPVNTNSPQKILKYIDGVKSGGKFIDFLEEIISEFKNISDLKTKKIDFENLKIVSGNNENVENEIKEDINLIIKKYFGGVTDVEQIAKLREIVEKIKERLTKSKTRAEVSNPDTKQKTTVGPKTINISLEATSAKMGEISKIKKIFDRSYDVKDILKKGSIELIKNQISIRKSDGAYSIIYPNKDVLEVFSSSYLRDSLEKLSKRINGFINRMNDLNKAMSPTGNNFYEKIVNMNIKDYQSMYFNSISLESSNDETNFTEILENIFQDFSKIFTFNTELLIDKINFAEINRVLKACIHCTKKVEDDNELSEYIKSEYRSVFGTSNDSLDVKEMLCEMVYKLKIDIYVSDNVSNRGGDDEEGGDVETTRSSIKEVSGVIIIKKTNKLSDVIGDHKRITESIQKVREIETSFFKRKSDLMNTIVVNNNFKVKVKQCLDDIDDVMGREDDLIVYPLKFIRPYIEHLHKTLEGTLRDDEQLPKNDEIHVDSSNICVMLQRLLSVAKPPNIAYSFRSENYKFEGVSDTVFNIAINKNGGTLPDISNLNSFIRFKQFLNGVADVETITKATRDIADAFKEEFVKTNLAGRDAITALLEVSENGEVLIVRISDGG